MSMGAIDVYGTYLFSPFYPTVRY